VTDSPPGGTGNHACGEKEGDSVANTEARIERLLDEMEKPGVSDDRLDEIKKQIEFLKSLKA
jgi:hypothetical protein